MGRGAALPLPHGPPQVTFDQFQKVQRPFPFPCRVRYSLGCPFLDGLGFKVIADRVWETVSFVFGGKNQNTRFDVKNLPNRSLVYWNIGVYQGSHGTDLAALKRYLPKIEAHFFIVHHNSDNPRFPQWLLEEPKVPMARGVLERPYTAGGGGGGPPLDPPEPLPPPSSPSNV